MLIRFDLMCGYSHLTGIRDFPRTNMKVSNCLNSLSIDSNSIEAREIETKFYESPNVTNISSKKYCSSQRIYSINKTFK